MVVGLRFGIPLVTITIISLILHIVGISYEGWPCGSLYSDNCSNFPYMRQVLILLLVSTFFQFISLVLLFVSLSELISSRIIRWCQLVANVLMIISALLSIWAIFFHYDMAQIDTWCVMISGFCTGMMIAAAILQIWINQESNALSSNSSFHLIPSCAFHFSQFRKCKPKINIFCLLLLELLMCFWLEAFVVPNTWYSG